MYDNLLRTVKILYIIIYARLSKEEKINNQQKNKAKVLSTNLKYVESILKRNKKNILTVVL